MSPSFKLFLIVLLLSATAGALAVLALWMSDGHERLVDYVIVFGMVMGVTATIARIWRRRSKRPPTKG